ncbi:MAG: helix-turn-helix domain-containing protein [Chromatiales bacterium]|nr:helix-turn-helix domain-containing protein [Chromatiales bacterium]
MDAARPVVALLALDEVTAATLYGLFDIFSSAGRDWPLLTRGTATPGALHPVIVSPSGAGFRTRSGAWVQPDCALDQCPAPTLICIPDLALAPGETLAGRHPEAIAWLTDELEAGAIVATACTGSFALAEAGLLDERDATTHWAYCETLARRYPSVRVHPHRALVISGPEQRLVMGGGGTSWLDLALYLVGRLVGTQEAIHLARLYLIEWHGDGQLPYASLATTCQQDDAVITGCQQWAAQHYETHAPVTRMIELSGLPERSFKRRFKQATGMTPMDYIHTLRLEEAKQMLEAGDAPVERIALEVGYEDAGFFRRLFQRRVGMTPTRYRRRFRGLRQALQVAVAVDPGGVTSLISARTPASRAS